MKMKALAPIALGLACAATSAVADNHNGPQTGWYFGAGAGYMDFDNQRDAEDSAHYMFSAGYRFNKNWAVELAYSNHDTEAEFSSAQGIDAYRYQIDGLYYFETNTNWAPYVSAGLGQNFFSPDGLLSETDTNEFAGNVGAGITYDLTSQVSLRGGANLYFDFDNTVNYDSAYTLGAVWYPFAQAPAKMELKDTDGDGVYDHLDRCPNTPAGAKVDENGCAMMLNETVRIKLEVLFDFDKSDVKPVYLPKIQEVAEFLRKYPETVAVIEGHTDSIGTVNYNQGLSQDRANALRAVLVNKFGIDNKRIESVGYGEARPVASNMNREGRAKNRRSVALITASTERMMKK